MLENKKKEFNTFLLQSFFQTNSENCYRRAEGFGRLGVKRVRLERIGPEAFASVQFIWGERIELLRTSRREAAGSVVYAGHCLFFSSKSASR